MDGGQGQRLIENIAASMAEVPGPFGGARLRTSGVNVSFGWGVAAQLGI
jgi:hypothetical protein